MIMGIPLPNHFVTFLWPDGLPIKGAHYKKVTSSLNYRRTFVGNLRRIFHTVFQFNKICNATWLGKTRNTFIIVWHQYRWYKRYVRCARSATYTLELRTCLRRCTSSQRSRYTLNLRSCTVFIWKRIHPINFLFKGAFNQSSDCELHRRHKITGYGQGSLN